jgi:hypothetical protein
MLIATVAPIIPGIRRNPFDNPAWLFDLKLDGFRGLAHLPSQGACCRGTATALGGHAPPSTMASIKVVLGPCTHKSGSVARPAECPPHSESD